VLRAAALAALVAAAPSAAVPPAGEAYEETPIVLSAAARLPPEKLAGERHRVLERVENDGFMNHWRIESDWGEFAADSDHLLEVRLREFNALAQLEEVTRSQAFLDALERAFTGPWKAARQVVEQPVAAAKRVPDGVARMFRRKKRQVRDLAEEAREEYRELKREIEERRAERDAEEAARAAAAPDAGAGAEAGAEAEDPEAERAAREQRRAEALDEAKEVAGDIGDEAKRYFQRKSGYRKARRDWAKLLGVDPYGDNEALNRELFRVAAASAVGGFSARLVPVPRIPGLSELGDVHDLVYQLDALDLRLRNEKILAELGFDRSVWDPLYDNRAWNGTLLTELVDALDRLRAVDNHRLLVLRALAAATRDEARFLAAGASHYAALHEGAQPLAGFIERDEVVAARTAAGPVVVALAVDRLAWTETWAELWEGALPRLVAAGDGRVELHLRGESSPELARHTAEQGVRLLARAF